MNRSILIAKALLILGGAFAAPAALAQAPVAPDTKAVAAQAAPAGKAEKASASEVMKRIFINNIKLYGFIRTYFAFDTRESLAGTEDLYYYMPKDVNIGTGGEDLNDQMSFRFAALTTRLGLDFKDFIAGEYKIGGKIEADFYAGLNGSTGTAQLRLRQAFVSVARDSRVWKIGQTWHPMAADMPDIFSLETGAPFGPFNRSPQVNFEWNYTRWGSLTVAGLWQMQYTSTGPNGASADYIKYGCTPEFYLGLNFKTSKSLFRIGGDVLSIKPRWNDGKKKVRDRLTTFNAFVYAQTRTDHWTFKGKVTYGNDGGHMNLVGGYGVSKIYADGNRDYVATNNVSSWFTASARYNAWQPQILLGYIENIGTMKGIVSREGETTFWQKNNAGTLARMYRIQPELIYNLGKFQIGIEYMMTAAHYGKADVYKHATTDLHWVYNHRVQAMVKFSF